MTQNMRFEHLEQFGFGPEVMKRTKICFRCAAVFDAAGTSCPDCGETLSETLFDRYKRQHRCCPDCDTVLAPGSQYCPNCGRPLARGDPETERPQGA